MLKIFIGYDHRQPIAYNVLQQSIARRSSKPVSITPLIYNQLPISHRRLEQGLTPFTFTRFFVPWLCNFQGLAVFMDIDMLVQDDIAKLFDLANSKYAVQVIKNEKRFEWASLMLFNCEKCTNLTPHYINNLDNKGLHRIEWANEEEIGDLPAAWNHLVGYDKPRTDASLVHFTQGLPCYQETITSEYAKEWNGEHQFMNSAYPWVELMGHSVHAAKLPDGRVVPKFVAKAYSA
jgi:hypothetical protein